MVAHTGIATGAAETTLARARDGDVDALAAIIAAHHEDMARIAYLITRDAHLAQDAVQTAWASAWQYLGSLRDPERLRPWLMSIAANEARRLARRRGRTTVREIAIPEAAGAGGDPGDRARALDLRLALQRLSPDDRALLGLRFVAGLDSGEIAHDLGMTASGVRSRLSRVLARLRTELGDD